VSLQNGGSGGGTSAGNGAASMVVSLLIAIIHIYTIIVIVRVIFSWLPARHQANQFYEFVYAITEPAMRPLRRIIPPLGGFDLSPIALLLILGVARGLLKRL
jgi:YggT family protein